MFFLTFYSSKDPENNASQFPWKYEAARLFSTVILIRNVCLIEQKISILQLFLKDHVTPKTVVMKQKIQLSSQE